MNMDRFLSVVIPAYNEQSVLPHTVKAVCETLSRERIPFEMIFVDDGSQDGTWECIRALSGGRTPAYAASDFPVISAKILLFLQVFARHGAPAWP